MIRNENSLKWIIAVLLLPSLIGSLVCSTGCTTGAASGAAEGAAIGATTSALGTLVVGLVFNDRNLSERVARSAVYGATAGAVAGGVAGAARDQQIRHQAEARVAQDETEQKAGAAEKQQMEEVEIREAIGTANFYALDALSNCRFGDAVKLAKESEDSPKEDYREASLWIQAIAAVMEENNDELDRLYAELVKLDSELGKPEVADSALAEALAMLEEDRVARGLSPTCD